jgi:ribosomal protein S18 acetylase RimI-like enzyme
MGRRRISTMLIRPAEVADAHAIATVHVTAWNETYRGIMPDSLLDRLNVEERAETWAARLATFEEFRQTVMVVDDGGDIVGFAGCGPARKDNLGSDGEIYMINIVNRAKRRHLGAKLMRAMADALEAWRFKTAGLWVLEKNAPARAFYARLGGIPGIASKEHHDGIMLTDLAILWPRIATLRERADELLSASR